MKVGIARVFIGGGRRYLTLKAACLSEAKARVKAAFKKRRGYFLDEGDEYPARLINRVARMLENAHRRQTQ